MAEENLDEWILGNKVPHLDGREFEVWLDDGSVRLCVRRSSLYHLFTLFFVNSADSREQSLCDERKIRGWRLMKKEPKNLNEKQQEHYSPGFYASRIYQHLQSQFYTGFGSQEEWAASIRLDQLNQLTSSNGFQENLAGSTLFKAIMMQQP